MENNQSNLVLKRLQHGKKQFFDKESTERIPYARNIFTPCELDRLKKMPYNISAWISNQSEDSLNWWII